MSLFTQREGLCAFDASTRFFSNKLHPVTNIQ